ncbi:Threonine--tRNA ligase [Candidatus Trichorickettsia mobilis]|uniref:Threonine--tRNA ligase n=1 Tax=Candidatus Trichorickettsia mobilis TaxID=1346319 RepID=A0ABZ0UUN0_9RICK|nr:threonine--tRNA ligase [Candidatus Trichorickettsia mobilis]WPY00609.1 Threonine--tRNA ligase [Candidatus Trichorickettsia mobilis]
MINIELPDKTKMQFELGTTGFDIASKISSSLAKEALVIEVDGQLKDLSLPINSDASIRILTAKDQECLEVLRHDAAHILAEAAKELFQDDVQVTIGPAIENGFYYDFATSKPFTPEDIVALEKRMHEIVKRNEKITREVWNRDEAIKFFRDQKESYKAEIIESIPVDQQITIYKQGNFVDICRGPHSPSTGKVKHFKLMKIAGAYWRGDSKNQMLQRIYGTAWATASQLDNYLNMLEEAEKRDHRKVGRELDLFHFQDEAQGMPFWHDKGWSIYRTIEQYIRTKIRKAGYIEVKTPVLLDKSLWEASGHWEKFRENMFALEADEKILALKPMNCPCHVQIFKQGTKSYRDLPLRMAEFGMCHRNEASGGLHGLMRVRSMVQDDAHIFCTNDQIISETVNFCKLLQEVYSDFGFNVVNVKFSDRPALRAGTDEVWDQAESALQKAVVAAGLEYTLNPGDGAFYGPKLEFHLRDAIGRDWQCGTLQVDFVLPERLDAVYIAAGGEKKRPVMLHRAILGSLERFIGILIEEYVGKFPLWLAPTQVAVITITNDSDEYAAQVNKLLVENGIRSELDISAEKVNYKVRNFSSKKVPLIAVVGKQEVLDGTITLRTLGSSEQKVMSVKDLIQFILLDTR